MQLLIKIQDLYFTSSTLLKHKPDEHITARYILQGKIFVLEIILLDCKIFKNVLISQGFCDTKGIIM